MGSRLLHHGKELSEQIRRHLHLIFSFPQEEWRYRETGADCREIVVRVDCVAVWKIGT